LVTGASRGIGFGIAGCLAKQECDIAILDVLAEKDAHESIDLLRTHGAEVLYCRGDVAAAGDRAQALESVRQQFGRLDILVNNAGVAPKHRVDILDATEESYVRVMRINLQGPYFLTQDVARWMIDQKKAGGGFAGCIVNISSISATVASASRGEYCLSKAGVSMATKLWAARLGEFDIPVYEIRPGIIQTDMTAAVREKYDRLIDDGLLVQKRWGLPEDVGRAVAMLVRGELAYSTGQVIMVDGGYGVERL